MFVDMVTMHFRVQQIVVGPLRVNGPVIFLKQGRRVGIVDEQRVGAVDENLR